MGPEDERNYKLLNLNTKLKNLRFTNNQCIVKFFMPGKLRYEESATYCATNNLLRKLRYKESATQNLVYLCYGVTYVATKNRRYEKTNVDFRIRFFLDFKMNCNVFFYLRGIVGLSS